MSVDSEEARSESKEEGRRSPISQAPLVRKKSFMKTGDMSRPSMLNTAAPHLFTNNGSPAGAPVSPLKRLSISSFDSCPAQLAAQPYLTGSPKGKKMQRGNSILTTFDSPSAE